MNKRVKDTMGVKMQRNATHVQIKKVSQLPLRAEYQQQTSRDEDVHPWPLHGQSVSCFLP